MRNLGKEKQLYVKPEEAILDLLSLKYKLDRRVIEYIAHYPFRFLKRAMIGNELKPIRLKYFGVFYMKKTQNKLHQLDNRYNQLIKEYTIDEVFSSIQKVNFDVKHIHKNDEFVYNYLKYLVEIKDLVTLNKIYKLCRNKKKFPHNYTNM
jgi:hypothetical protein